VLLLGGEKMLMKGIMPIAWKISIKKLPDEADLYEFIYEETLSDDTPQEAIDNVSAMIVEAIKCGAIPTESNMKSEVHGKTLKYAVSIPFHAVANAMVMEFMMTSTMGDLSLRDIMMTAVSGMIKNQEMVDKGDMKLTEQRKTG
jgi:hypothetical protein